MRCDYCGRTDASWYQLVQLGDKKEYHCGICVKAAKEKAEKAKTK